MKNKILASLKTRFSGVDDAILTRIAEKKAIGITDESQIDSIVEGITFQDVLNSYGDYRANSAQQTAVANYERKHGIKDGKPIETPPPAPDLDVKKLISEAMAEAVNPLKTQIEALQQEKAESERKALIASKAKEYGIPDGFVPMLNIDDKADLDVFMKEAKQMFANIGFKGAVPPASGGGAKTESEEIASLIRKGTEEAKK